MTNNLLLASDQKNDWLTQLSDVVTCPDELLQMLGLANNPQLLEGKAARRLFPLRVPKGFISRMERNNPTDPLLLQILTSKQEFVDVSGYSTDPLDEQQSAVPGLLHKYQNRVLLLVKGGCAVNCRYCFRRHFPYAENQGNKLNWLRAIEYITAHPELDEVIFSGGDPLMAKDQEISWLFSTLAAIPHIKRIRIHSRLPIVIPARITDDLVNLFTKTSLQVILVNHINHPNEINQEFRAAMARLR
jgi:L-lysine 2,3-aminomutase